MTRAFLPESIRERGLQASPVVKPQAESGELAAGAAPKTAIGVWPGGWSSDLLAPDDVLAYQRDLWERSILFWDTLRRRRIRQDKETDDLENVPLEHPDPSQLDQLIGQRTSEEVRRALDKLGGRARMALVMRYYSDMSYDEIADALGVRRAFVGVVLLRARHELRQALEGNAALAAGGVS